METCNVVLSFSLWMKSYGVTIQIKKFSAILLHGAIFLKTFYKIGWFGTLGSWRVNRRHKLTILFCKGTCKPHTADTVRWASIHIKIACCSWSYTIYSFTATILLSRLTTESPHRGRGTRWAALSSFRFWAKINLEFPSWAISIDGECQRGACYHWSCSSWGCWW